MPANLENAAVATRLEKVLFSFQSQRRAMPKNVQTTTQLCSFHILAKKCNDKECSNYLTVALISHASKVMLKIFQARFQQYVNRELPDVLEKAEEPEIKLPTSAGSWKKQESSRKTSISALLTISKPFTVWITINCGKF